jgi:GntR family transcriptional regulator
MLTMSDWQLDSQSDEPLHLQFERQLTQRIGRGLWQPGHKIPSERELMEVTGLSRATIRQALASLVYQNILKKVHGSGTYVASVKYEQSLRAVYSFSEQLRQLGQTLHDTILRQSVEAVDAAHAAKLALPPGAKVIVIERLRVLQARSLMVSNAYVPFALCPDLASEPLTGSLYRMLAERFKLPILHATDKLEAMSADKRLATLLDIRIGSPLIYVERTAYTTHERIVHYGENYIRGDRCRFSIDLQSGQQTSLELKDTPEASITVS